MKILHALHGFPPEHDGGTELYVARLAAAQAAAGHDVIVAAGSYSDRYDGFVAEPAPGDGLRLYRISQRGLWSERWDHGAAPHVEASFARLLRELRPDLVHVHHWIRLTRNLVAATSALGIPALVTAHDLYATCPRIFRVREDAAFCERPLSVSSCLHCVPRESWMSDAEVAAQIERFAADLRTELEGAAAIVAPSQAHARVLARFTALPLERFTVVPHASLLAAEAGGGAAAGWPAPGQPLRLAHWGHLLPFKGPHVLLEALRRLGRGGDIELQLWGRADDPAYDARLVALADGLRVTRRPTFARDDLRQLRADLAVFPTLAHESHSFVLDEAFALGLPVLASERGAIPERLGAAGATFPAGDAAALAQALAAILDTPERLAAMRAAVPRTRDFAAHWQELSAVYDAARAGEPRQSRAGTLDRLSGWERIAGLYESHARELAARNQAAEEEVRSLRRQAADAWSAQQASEDGARAREAALAQARERLAAAEAAAGAARAELAAAAAQRDDAKRRLSGLEYRVWKLGRENRLALPLVIPAKVLLRLWDGLRKRGAS